MKTSVLYSQIIFHGLWLGFGNEISWSVCGLRDLTFEKLGKIFNLTLCKLLSRARGVAMFRGGTASTSNEYLEKPV